ncbi:hypothetical protein HMN09_00685200 [Mycena chlorophos]|uniref:Afadin and alpha-actinin-binding-domain-containing protein n=1 Tax=Mycena chlorophos TaxID=658473 RepID=A0A8H6T175_MYCCL|nr:hypothetical protein HMN09_00685200 [Mycena chlorophos]
MMAAGNLVTTPTCFRSSTMAHHGGVHWAEPSLSDISTVSTDVLATSSLEYVSSQLVAHGFAPAPGLSLDGLAKADFDRVVKCLLGMLSQRVQDMSRTEDLTTKLRTLSYDHERLTTMYRAAADTAANAEREAHLHKSRLTATTRLLQSSESAHKQTTAELTRARSALQSVRATHQAELKKKEREVEKMAERWTKLADMQAKAGGAASGLKCVNLKAVEARQTSPTPSPTLEENALRQSEEARQRLADDNGRLKGLLLGAVNEAQTMLYQARAPEREKDEEPAPLTNQTLFPMASADAANEKLASLLSALREAVNRPLGRPITSSPSSNVTASSDAEIERLQRTIKSLKADVERYQKELFTRATETQEIFDQFASEQQARDAADDFSMELMTVPERDAEKERLDKLKTQLERERDDFTEATVKLGHERASVRAEQMKLQDDKRSWEVEKMLSELPPTPDPSADSPAAPALKLPIRPVPTQPQSPRKSPERKIFTVGANRKPSRGLKRAALISPPRAANRVQPAFETEVILASLLPTSFVLPPPSPYSAFPAPTPLLLGSARSAAPMPSLLDALASSAPLSPSPPPVEGEQPSSPPTQSPEAPPVVSETPDSDLRKHLPLPFPMAKPLARGMIHAYSPAKPSPLSRILQMSQLSPASPEDCGGVSSLGASLSLAGLGLIPGLSGVGESLLGLESLPEEGLSALLDELDGEESGELFPAVVVTAPAPAPERPQEREREMTLAEELGVTLSPPESPDASIEQPTAGPSRPRSAAAVNPGRRPVFSRPGAGDPPRPSSAAEKGKGKGRQLGGTVPDKEKENGTARVMRPSSAASRTGTGTGSKVVVPPPRPTSASGARATTKSAGAASVAGTASGSANAKLKAGGPASVSRARVVAKLPTSSGSAKPTPAAAVAKAQVKRSAPPAPPTAQARPAAGVSGPRRILV